MTIATVVLIAVCGLAAGALWWIISRLDAIGPLALTTRAVGLLTGIPVVLLLAAAATGLDAPSAAGPLLVMALMATTVTTVTGGGLLASSVLRLADPTYDGRRSREPSDPSVPGEVLRGGAWIGGLERLAVLAALLAGWYEGVAVALGLKGLGRYPELRRSDASERFIIGTFASMLWVVEIGRAHV